MEFHQPVEEPEKILIIRLSSIGDIILTTPLIRAVRKRFPEVQLDFAVKEQFVDLLRSNPNIDNITVFNSKTGFKGLRAFKRSLKQENYDFVIDLHKNFRSVYLRNGISSGRILKYSKDYFKRSLLVWFGLNFFRKIDPVYLKYFRAVKSLETEDDGLGTEMELTPDAMSRVAEELKKNAYSSDRMMVALCPGAGFPTKRWLEEGYAAAGDFFAKRYNALVVFLGSGQDEPVCENVRKAMIEHSVSFCGKLNLQESAGVLKKSSVVITNDTGLMHIAQTQKRPVVAVFGPTVRELGYFPFPENSFVIEKNLKCRPCTHNGSIKCPKKHFRCMKDITAKEVIEAAIQLLDSDSSDSQKDIGKNVVSSI